MTRLQPGRGGNSPGAPGDARSPASPATAGWPAWAALAAGAALLAVHVRSIGGTGAWAGGWLLGFVWLVPWLWWLDRCRRWPDVLLAGYAMTLAFTAVGFSWFGIAIGRYVEVGPGVGLVVLLAAAPVFQPQLLAFALVRHGLRQAHGPLLAALGGAAAWVGTEWCVPKMLGDTLGHGLYPATLLRQAADLGGAAGLSVVLLLVNEALQAAWLRRRGGWRALALPLGLALALPLALAGYGQVRMSAARPAAGAGPAEAAAALRIGIVQANIADLEARRRREGAHAVVRELLDVHFAMSHDAIERQGADAVLWSETIYPTTFGRPKSEAGAEFDREILAMVNAAGVPFVFGTYEAAADGEYNVAAVVAPGQGLVGVYRKTRLFPFTERVPAWLDHPWLRRALPWTGDWRAGNGARVLPLRLRDGRELPVQALICRDDVDPALAIDAARLGARALLTMSNDAWFSQDPLGAELHQAVAAFRSIETRLPQFRVTTNGSSAVIDRWGRVQAGAAMNERTLVVGTLPTPEPTATPMVAWGDWVGRAGLAFLALLVMAPVWRRLATAGVPTGPPIALPAHPLRAVLLSPALRWATALLRGLSRGSLLALGTLWWLDEGFRAAPLAQIRWFGALVVLPELMAAGLLAACAVRLRVQDGAWWLARGRRPWQRMSDPIVGLRAWRWPLPAFGWRLHHASGRQQHLCIAAHDAAALARALVAAGLAAPAPDSAYATGRAAYRPGFWHAGVVKFIGLPLLLAVPAFVLHQRIAYGSALGEYLGFGPTAYATAFGLWWAGWVIAVVLLAAGLRGLVEALAWLGAALRPAHALAWRFALERTGLVALYLGLPGWLLWRLTGA